MAPLSCLGKQSKERKGRASLMKRGYFFFGGPYEMARDA